IYGMNFSRALLIFTVGHFFGAIIATVIAHYMDGSWATGPGGVGLSLPTTLIYFIALWALGRWQPLLINVAGLSLAGFVCAIYPTFCGVFRVYFLRVGLAVRFIVAQFGFLLLLCAVFSTLDSRCK